MDHRFVLTTSQLTQLLKDAAVAHHTFEATLGHADADWPAWYARFVADAVTPADWRRNDTTGVLEPETLVLTGRGF